MCRTYSGNDGVYAPWKSCPYKKLKQISKVLYLRYCKALWERCHLESTLSECKLRTQACMHTNAHAETWSGLSAISWTLEGGLLRNTLFTEGSDHKSSVEFWKSCGDLKHISVEKNKALQKVWYQCLVQPWHFNIKNANKIKTPNHKTCSQMLQAYHHLPFHTTHMVLSTVLCYI